MTKTRMMERDGEIVIVSQQVGNQAQDYQWVEHDARRHADDGLTLYYRIDRTELPPGISWDDTEAAIEAAVATFNQVRCGKNLRLERVDEDLDHDLGFAQHELGLGGDPEPRADITFAGWVPQQFFESLQFPDANAIAVPIVYADDEQSLLWGLDAIDPYGAFSDVNNDGKADLHATEIYFSTDPTYVVDDDDLANTVFAIDLQSIVLHELGHALGMDHFGRSTFILDDQGNLVDLIINRNSVNLMNSDNYFVKRDLSGSDNGSFCGIYGDWGKGPAGP